MPDITGAKPVNNAVISTNIKIKIGEWVVGYIRNITETQARPSNPQYEVGSVGPIDMVPAQPAAVTLACTKIAVYGGNLINVIGTALKNNEDSIEAAPGLSLAETKSAWKHWLAQAQGKDAASASDMSLIFTLSHLPIGFTIELDETFPVPNGTEESVMITTYHNCWIVRYTRPITASGDLLVAETADINAQFASYAQGRKITQDSIEVVS